MITNEAQGLLNGTKPNNYGGQNNMTRAQACVVISRLLDAMGDPAGSSGSDSGLDFSASYKSGKYYQALQNLTLTGDYRKDIIAVAESQIGYRESDSETQLDGSV